MLIPEVRMLPVTAIPTPLVLVSVYSNEPQENLPTPAYVVIPLVVLAVIAIPAIFEPPLTLQEILAVSLSNLVYVETL